ncbi:ABC transporter ATP-binding protein [Loktanella sp. M215]|uniref:ABC transporter ATP-binding protein n=1 Tax=Loktanella sp. M215 TaxID=2675431 RepID=UPI001F01750B|nr:oligopeptide/dipeptide ABC transporter ATP-binding protein [Loktanella sp. M215]MCF7701240.1 ATP-binding cassette domain-containing protein [Loktanella sp. M215]
MNSDIILETQALQKRFTGRKPFFGEAKVVRAVDGINLKIRRGETLAIVGESGCGKSTLARLLVRLMPPSDGTVVYQGRNIANVPDEEMRHLRRDLQFIFQDPFSSLNPRMTIGALIEEPLLVHNIGDKQDRRVKVAAMLARVGLPASVIDRYPHEFSGGQRQRIGIARALITEPKVVIGDEPVSALDVSIQAQVINILQDLKEALGLTLIIIAHDLAVVRHMADRVAVMYLGEIVEQGPVADLFANPKHPYTAALIAAIPVAQVGARSAATQLQGDPPNPIDLPTGCRFHPRCPHATEVCSTTRPALTAAGPDRWAACHHAATLSLQGYAATGQTRSAAAQARFDLYRDRSADAARTTTPT